MKMFQVGIFLLWTTALFSIGVKATPGLIDGFRPPAVPLIVFDPYINLWSNTNNLYDSFPILWDGTTKGMGGAIRVDGTSYRFLGQSNDGLPKGNVQQLSVQVLPTTTIYKFRAGGVDLSLSFITPNDPRDLQALSEPITYIQFGSKSNDGKTHKVELYFDITGEITANDVEQLVGWKRSSESDSNLVVLSMGKSNQTYFVPKGDGVGINWGYSYVAVPKSDGLQTVFASSSAARSSFARSGTLPASDDTRQPRKVNDEWPVTAVRFSFSTAASGKPVERRIIYSYDDVFSMSYFGTPFKAYWKQSVPSMSQLLKKANSNFESNLANTQKLDTAILAQTEKAGGKHYSTIASLCWRQTLGAHKLVWNSIKSIPWLFLKEISSNGDFSTVDVLFPAIPMLLWANPGLAELLLLPHLSYANNEAPIKYGLEWAPHQLGTWPVADATPLQQEQMPVEETGNLLLIAEYLALVSKGSNKFTSKMYPTYKGVLDGWAKYLTSGYNVKPSNGTFEKGIDRPGTDLPGTPVMLPAGSKARDCQATCVKNPNCASWAFDDCGGRTCWMKGSNTAQQTGQTCRTSGYIPGKLVLPDPGYQLCTDDFLGPIPHNVNLAAKGIIAVDAYSGFLKAVGRSSEAPFYSQVAKSFATYWLKNGKDGDHYKLEYDQSGFSLQYNMIFQRFLKTSTFPESVFESESDFYLKNGNKYGTPLNSNAAKDHRAFTKFDWYSWAGALTRDSTKAQKYWRTLYNYANETPSRVPLSDWYDTKTGAWVSFRARPVVGGFYAWMLLQNNPQLVVN
eukprot:TRINITY_DN4697_c0_g1_i1.p1 TRINITY_DN4697_c0_g1~~TRINITY_DN4697_c0_g1_i1.p1  ORF type:complete len:792 (+),score=207.87 TRINITY_DN4697_c0_g1_i1:205-2580(+)